MLRVCVEKCMIIHICCIKKSARYLPISYPRLVDNEGRVQVGLYVSLGDLVLSGLRNVTAEGAVFEIGTGQPFDL